MLAQKFGVALPEQTEKAATRTRRDAGAARSAAEDARDRGGLLPRAAREPGRRARAAAAEGPRRRRAGTIEQLGLGYAPQSRDGAEEPAARSRDSRRRCCCRAAWSSQRDNGDVVDRFRNRLMVPICRDSRVGDRLRRPGDGRRAGAEVSEFARDADLLERTNAVRPEPDEAVDPQARIRGPGRGLLRLRAGVSDQAAPVVAVLRHGADRASRRSCCGGSRPRSSSATTRTPPAQGAAARSCELLVARGVRRQRRGAGQGRRSRYVHPTAGSGRVPRKAAHIRGRIWSTCWIRRPRASISARTTAGGSFWARCWPSRPGSRMRPPATSSPTGSPTRRALQKRSSGRKFERPPSAGAPTLTARELPSFGQLKNAEKGLDLGADS